LPEAHFGLAAICFMQSDFLGAAHHFREVTRLDPLRAGAFINLGAIYNHLGRHADAISALRRGIQLDPQKADGYYNLGLVHRQLDQLELAADAYREAVRIQPKLAEAHLNLGNILLDQDKYSQAITSYRQALQLRANWTEALQGIEMAEAGLAGGFADDDEPEESVIDGLESAEGFDIASGMDAKRQLEAAVHGNHMKEIHLASAEAQKLGTHLGEEVCKRLEQALKELSACLLKTDTPAHVLGNHLLTFDQTIHQFQSARQQVQEIHDRIREAGEAIRKK